MSRAGDEYYENEDAGEDEEDVNETVDNLMPLLGLVNYAMPQKKNSDAFFRILNVGIGFWRDIKKEEEAKKKRIRKARIEISAALRQRAAAKKRIALLQQRIRETNEKIKQLRQQKTASIQQQPQAQQRIIFGELPSVPKTPTLECPDNPGEFKDFLDYITNTPTSILILGSKGQGKSALGHALLEYIHVKSGKPAVILGAPKEKARLFPNWIRIVESWDEVPEGGIVLVDEAGILLFSRNTMSKANKSFAEINAISRQKNLTLIYTSQSSRSVDVNVTYAGEVQLIYKKPSQLALDQERPELKKWAKDAFDLLSSCVADKSRMKEYSAVYFFSGDGKFLMRNGLASYWSEDLSRLFSGVSMKSKEQEIRDLYRQGLTQQEIARRLGVTQGYVSRVLSEK